MTDMPSNATLSPPYLANHGKSSDGSALGWHAQSHDNYVQMDESCFFTLPYIGNIKMVTAHKVVIGLVPVNLSLSITGNGGINFS
jgi:hypothetical protein